MITVVMHCLRKSQTCRFYRETLDEARAMAETLMNSGDKQILRVELIQELEPIKLAEYAREEAK